MGSIDPATWNDLEDDPQYFPVYGVVEIGEGADYALRFDGDDDHIVIDEKPTKWGNNIEIEGLGQCGRCRRYPIHHDVRRLWLGIVSQ